MTQWVTVWAVQSVRISVQILESTRKYSRGQMQEDLWGIVAASLTLGSSRHCLKGRRWRVIKTGRSTSVSNTHSHTHTDTGTGTHAEIHTGTQTHTEAHRYTQAQAHRHTHTSASTHRQCTYNAHIYVTFIQTHKEIQINYLCLFYARDWAVCCLHTS